MHRSSIQKRLEHRRHAITFRRTPSLVSLLVIVIHKVIRQTKRFPAKPTRHLGEAFRLNEMVEWEGWKHCAVAVDVRFHEEGGAAYAVEVDFGSGVAFGVCNTG